MKPADIAKLGTLAFHQCLIPLKNNRQSKRHIIVGLDTEYDSKTRELLTLQLAYREKAELYIIPPNTMLTWSALESYVLEFLSNVCDVPITHRNCRAIKLICYFSIAETQHIADITQAKCFETSIGVDFTWRGKGGRTIEIIDLMKFFNNPAQPLAKVAKSFGYEKLEWKWEKGFNRKMLHKALEQGFREYAINDAILAERIFNDLRDVYLNRFGVDILFTKTPASTSSAIFRSRYLDRKCTQPNVRLRKLALKAAWGGRNEAFQRGIVQGRIYEYDAFSEYPNSAVQLRYLPAAEDWRTAMSMHDVLQWNGLSRIRFVFPPDTKYPCLPVFADNKLYYPLSGESYCTNAEIALAYRIGANISLISGYYYRSGTDSLSRYMSDFLKERTEAKRNGDAISAHVIKLAINSLIGKFIQRVVKSDLNSLNEISSKSGIPVPTLRRMDPDTLAVTARAYGIDPEKINRVSVGNSFYPEWNALILGYARAATSEFIIRLNEAGHVPLLCSTDSVIFHTPEHVKEPDETYLCGGISFERRECGTKLSVLRTRLYRLCNDERETIKLAHHAVARRTNAERLFDQWESDPDQSVFRYPLSRIRTYRESVTMGHDYGAEHGAQRCVRLGFDHKRRLLQSGQTEPWGSVNELLDCGTKRV